MAAQNLIPASIQTVTADTGTPGAIDTSTLGNYSGPFQLAVRVPTTATGPVYLTANSEAASADTDGIVGIPVPTVAGSTWYSGTLLSGDADAGLYLYAASATDCVVSLIRVSS